MKFRLLIFSIIIISLNTSCGKISEHFELNGVDHVRNGEFDDAIKDFNRAIRIDKSNFIAYRRLADLYFDLKTYDKAKINYKKSLDLRPDQIGFDILNLQIATIEYINGNNIECKKLCKEVLNDEYNHDDDTPYGLLALTYLYFENYDSAILYLDTAIKLNPLSHYFNNRGFIYSQIGQKDKAIRDYNKAIDIGARTSDLYGDKAVSDDFWSEFITKYMKVSDLRKSIILPERQVYFNPAIYYYNRGHLKLEIGDSVGYERDINKSEVLGYP